MASQTTRSNRSVNDVSISHIITLEFTEVSKYRRLASNPKMIHSTKSTNPPFCVPITKRKPSSHRKRQ